MNRRRWVSAGPSNVWRWVALACMTVGVWWVWTRSPFQAGGETMTEQQQCPVCPPCLALQDQCPRCLNCRQCKHRLGATLFGNHERPLPFDWRPHEDNLGSLGLIVVDSPKMLLCSVPTAGATTLRRLVLALREGGRVDLRDDPHQASFALLRSLPWNSVHAMLNDPEFAKVAFVRNPYSRAYAGFQDKLVGEGQQHRLRRSGVTEPVTEFTTFAGVLAGTSSADLDEHWRDQSSFCLMRYVEYDHIGRFEHLEEDAVRIFSEIGVLNTLKWSPAQLAEHFAHSPHTQRTEQDARRYFRQHTELLTVLGDRFHEDFQRFGYEEGDLL